MTANALISVVDDDESVRDSASGLLRSVGYQVATFESSDQFLKSGRLSATGCLILDVRMPGMDGLELQRRLNFLESRVPIIFVTAHDNRANQQQAMDEGAHDFLRKPVAAKVFLKTIEAAIQKGRRSGVSERK